MNRIAIQQPYAVPPYHGYYRLMEQADLFVMLDDCQFVRRGFMHRNRLRLANGELDWFTLPLKKAPQQTALCEMHFADDAVERVQEQMRRFPCFERLPDDLWLFIQSTRGSLVDYAHLVLKCTAEHLGIKATFAQSRFSLVPRDLEKSDRMIALCKHYGATELLNAPGGRELYDPAYFASHGIKLEFLPPWEGPMESVLELIAEKEMETA